MLLAKALSKSILLEDRKEALSIAEKYIEDVTKQRQIGDICRNSLSKGYNYNALSFYEKEVKRNPEALDRFLSL